MSNGNVKGKVTRPNLNNSSGMWKLDDVVLSSYENKWPLASMSPVKMLLIGGGGSGAGSARLGAGGGAGGVLMTNTASIAFATTYTITIGAGASNTVAWYASANGANSSIVGQGIDVVAHSGGGAGLSGGSNGGNNTGNSIQPQYANFNHYGNPGGSGGASGGGGGGGAFEAGKNDAAYNQYEYYAGNGGMGIFSTISGSNTAYAGGGGGGADVRYIGSAQNPAGPGGEMIGFGGGGYAGYSSTGAVLGTPFGAGKGSFTGQGDAAIAYTGSGGGGSGGPGGQFDSGARGGAGGSGVFILSYPDTYPELSNTTGSPTYTVSSNNRIYRWTGSGSFRIQ